MTSQDLTLEISIDEAIQEIQQTLATESFNIPPIVLYLLKGDVVLVGQ